MKKQILPRFFSPAILLPLLFPLLVACSDVSMVNNKRDPEFYKNNINTSENFAEAEVKISELKILETDDEYPLRIALFDNNRFYYQIDKLGNGYGNWKFKDGALELSATRPIFDINLYLSAAKPEGNILNFRFIDRHGIHTVETWLRDPNLMINQGLKAPELRSYTKSPKNI
jgi:hypothetical protein